MLYNIGHTNTTVIYCNSTVITKVMLLYNTEWWHDHEMAVNYCSKIFYNIGSRWNTSQLLEEDLDMKVSGKMSYGLKNHLVSIL